MQDQLSAAAARVAAKRRELEQRLAELHQAHPFNKMAAARLCTSCIFELLDHQDQVNQIVTAAITEALTRTELLAAKANCAFSSVPAASVKL